MSLLKEMLLIEEPSVFRLYKEMAEIATYFMAPVFTIALILEFFGDMDFGGLLKKLLIVSVFMGAFYHFHTAAVDLALDSASVTLKKVSPRNLFVKKWYYAKVKTTEKKEWNIIQSMVIPNLNDLLGTAFFLLAKVFVWLLKLIYSSVYHFTYVFSGVTAILYFLGWTKDALKGTIQASLWCMVMPFVVVAILALVGNSIDEAAIRGDLMVSKVDTILWLFGVMLLLLISPLISFGMIRGEGIHSFGSKMGSMVVSSGMKALAFSPIAAGLIDKASSGLKKAGTNALFEPSIKELLRKEGGAGKKRSALVEQKGGLRNPLKGKKSVDERIAAAGLTREEAQRYSRVIPNEGQAYSTGGGNGEQSGSYPNEMREKSSYQFDKNFWEGITPEHREGIRRKYGISEETPAPNTVYYPVSSGRENRTVEGRSMRRDERTATPRPTRGMNRQDRGLNQRGTNELPRI